MPKMDEFNLRKKKLSETCQWPEFKLVILSTTVLIEFNEGSKEVK